MELATARPRHEPETGGAPLAPRTAVALAAGFGLVGGYLDVVGIVLKKDVFHAGFYYREGRHFPWAVPVGSLALVLVPGLIVAAISRLRPGSISARAAAWLFATLVLWVPLLRLPLHGLASLLLAAGLGRGIGTAVARRVQRRAWPGLVGLLVVLGVLAAGSSGRRALAEFRAEGRLPAPPRGARNVLLIVLDTVRADSLGLYGYSRDTTPHLARWARRGVRFDWALAPAPWTFPSHATFFTGRWPYKLNAHWQMVLDPRYPTLAEYLGGRGYRTAGFVANTSFCSYESGLDRGFVHYEDYIPSPRAILGSTVPGRWIVREVLHRGDPYGQKWARYQSRDAPGINRAFLDWLARRDGSRPFFAFLNYLDAHEPFVRPRDEVAHFGLRPASDRDDRMLLDYWDLDKRRLSARDVTLARDAYDDGIAALDRQVGSLLDELDRRGILRDTVVIVTSDHGESFGEHGVFNHGYSLYLHEVRVPLLILAPTVTAGRVVAAPVSLRDLPATVVDLLGLAPGSPFPGRSLAGADNPRTSPALSEAAIPAVLDPHHGPGPTQQGFAMSLVAGGRHYIRDSAGVEELFDLGSDPQERRDRNGAPAVADAMSGSRGTLLQVLTADPPAGGAAGAFVGRFRSALESPVPGRARRGEPSPR